MNNINILAIKTQELIFTNKIEQAQVEMSIGNKYAYNVRYGSNNICRGEFTAEVFRNEDPESFNIKITMIATFSHPPETSKEDIHRYSYGEIFPYVRAAVTNATASAGIPPIYLPYVDISGQDVYRIELPKKT